MSNYDHSTSALASSVDSDNELRTAPSHAPESAYESTSESDSVPSTPDDYSQEDVAHYWPPSHSLDLARLEMLVTLPVSDPKAAKGDISPLDNRNFMGWWNRAPTKAADVPLMRDIVGRMHHLWLQWKDEKLAQGVYIAAVSISLLSVQKSHLMDTYFGS